MNLTLIDFKIEVGYDCDLLVLTPDNKIDTVIIEGEKCNN